MRSILMVCTANLCRSPMAEGVLKKLLAEKGLLGRITVESAGVQLLQPGIPPSPMAVERAALRGYDLSGITARAATGGDFDDFDLILGMAEHHVASLKKVAPTHAKHKVELFLDYGDRYNGESIPDPWGGKPKDYDLALDMIEDGCRGLASLLRA